MPSHGDAAARDGSVIDPRPATPDLGFVLCIETGVLERQAKLLCGSIRRYAGRFASCPIYAVSPRPGHRPAAATIEELVELGVEYLEEDLNTRYSALPMITNKPLSAAHVEASTNHELLVVLDTDTLMLDEPGELVLARDEDVAVRPADARGVSTTGLPGDRFDGYWRRLCATAGVSYDKLPLTRLSVEHTEVKAYYQTGCVCVRRERGVLRAWGRHVATSIQQGIGPGLDGQPRRGSVGSLVGDAARWWGADIPALTLGIWGATERVRLLSADYNYPLHLHERIEPSLRRANAASLVLVHYHWMLDAAHVEANPLLAPAFGLAIETLAWLGAQLPIDAG